MNGRLIAFAAAGILALAPAGIAAQELSPELQALDEQLPGSLINDPTDIVWPTQGSMSVEGIKDDTIPGGAARRYAIKSKGPDIWSSQTHIPLLAGIARGEVATVGFYARTISADTPDGRGAIAVRFQENAPPYSGFADTTLAIGPEWEWYEVSGTATGAMKRANATVVFQLAGAKQTIEIGQTIVVKGAPSIAGAPKVAAAQPTQTEKPALPGPLEGAGTLLNRPELRQWANNTQTGSFEDRADSTIWLGRTTRFTVDAVGENAWDLAANIPIEQAISAGDELLVAITAKTVGAQTEDGKALITMRLQENSPPYEGFAESTFQAGDQWQLVRVKATAPRDYPAGTAQVSLHLAAEIQAVDIGPVYVIKTQ